MGLIKEVLLLPVAPVRVTFWVSERITEEVNRSTRGKAAGVERLDQIREADESGEIDQDKAKALEEEVLEQQLARADDETKTKKDDFR
jgi:hypothetical protein